MLWTKWKVDFKDETTNKGHYKVTNLKLKKIEITLFRFYSYILFDSHSEFSDDLSHAVNV